MNDRTTESSSKTITTSTGGEAKKATTTQAAPDENGIISTSSTEFDLPRGQNYTTIITVITLLSVITVCMITVIVALCIEKRRHKRIQMNRRMAEAIADLRENSTDNAAYGGT